MDTHKVVIGLTVVKLTLLLRVKVLQIGLSISFHCIYVFHKVMKLLCMLFTAHLQHDWARLGVYLDSVNRHRGRWLCLFNFFTMFIVNGLYLSIHGATDEVLAQSKCTTPHQCRNRTPALEPTGLNHSQLGSRWGWGANLCNLRS